MKCKQEWCKGVVDPSTMVCRSCETPHACELCKQPLNDGSFCDDCGVYHAEPCEKCGKRTCPDGCVGSYMGRSLEEDAQAKEDTKRVAELHALVSAIHEPVCACYHTCADDPATACSLSGDFHVHAGEPCPVHPDAPGDH